MRRTVFAATVSAFALLTGAGQASAQADLRIGAGVQGMLDAGDPTGGDEEMGQYRYDLYSIRARSGQRLEAVMRSTAFDAFLEVFPEGSEDAIGSDDDGLGQGTDSRLRFTAPSSGVFTLRARTLGGLEGGAYSLALSERPAPARAPRPAPIRIGRDLAGTLSDGDPVSDDDAAGGSYDAYAFRARTGERFAVSLNASDFDPMVRVGRMERGSFISLGENDDAPGGGLNSYLIFTAPSSGEFVIRAMSLGGEGAGAYTIGLAEGPPPLAAAPIVVGGSVEGELAPDDGVNEAGERADAYRFTAGAGQRIEATLNADAFDAYLELFGPGGESLDQDDDGGAEGTSSRLVHTIQDAGEYTIQARALGDGTGAYVLSLGEAAAPPEAATLAFGQTIQGEIEEGGVQDDEGRGYDDYVFAGTEGNRVQVVMRSGDFDAYLQIGRDEEPFEALSSDDDGLGEGTDSRLNFILPKTGNYVVRASPLGSEAKGLYSIELTDRGPQPQPGGVLVGATARGTLGESDAIAEDGAYFDAYAVQVGADETLEVTLVSNAFDAYLDIGRETEGAWESLASDDDSLSDTHAKVEWTVEDAGAYVIRARSFAQGQTGDYALNVVRKP